jgi:hypothetical protein
MAPSTPTTTPHGSTTAVHLPHPMPPTVTDSLSQLLLRTWSEHVVSALLDVWTMYPTNMQIQAVTKLRVMQTAGVMVGGV